MAADTDTYLPVDPRSVAVWRWSTALGFVPPLTAFTVAMLVATASGAPGITPGIVLPLAIASIAFVVWWYPQARYRHLGYRVDDIGIVIRDGIFWHTQSALPQVRIQHTDVSQGPLQRRYGVATLKLYTAGSRFTRTELPGLDFAAAVALRDRLQCNGGGDAV